MSVLPTAGEVYLSGNELLPAHLKKVANSADVLKGQMAIGKPEDVFHRVVREEGYWGRYEASESDNGLDGFISDAYDSSEEFMGKLGSGSLPSE